ncbi:MAG: RNA-binding S4 domain-containing protein [Bacteroidota bacterium]|nr:RNA-binding S4 domain-containing protein [Bacteroidota bacterium]
MKVIELELQGEFIELNQLLKLAGLCASGGAGKMLVAQGRVTVDGNIELRKTCKIRAGQVVVFEDQRIDVIGTN